MGLHIYTVTQHWVILQLRISRHKTSFWAQVAPAILSCHGSVNAATGERGYRNSCPAKIVLKFHLEPGLVRSRPMCSGPSLPTTSASRNATVISTTPFTKTVAENASSVLLSNENAMWFHDPALMATVESAPIMSLSLSSLSVVTLRAIRFVWGHSQAEGVRPVVVVVAAAPPSSPL